MSGIFMLSMTYAVQEVDSVFQDTSDLDLQSKTQENSQGELKKKKKRKC